MRLTPIRPLVVALAACLAPLAAAAHGVQVRFDATDPAASPFPSNRYTVFDGSQRTLRRVNLPKPDCAVRSSDCADIDVLNTLDGFSTQPRITVPFSGDIDPATVNSNSVYLLNLGDVLSWRGAGDKVGINQIVWDPATKTLSFESDELLAEHTRYLLVVTNGVLDATGKKIKSNDDDDGRGNSHGHGHHRGNSDYARDVRDAMQSHRHSRGPKPVAVSLFTTQSISADLTKIMRSIKRSQPAPMDFMIGQGTGGAVRSVFATSAVQGIQFSRQNSTAGALSNSFLPTPALSVVPGAVGQVAYGRFASPEYRAAGQYIPATGTWTGRPQVQAINPLIAQIFVPSGTKPAGGWPVAIFGHGFTDSMHGAPWAVASVFASQGIATMAINVAGHGGGALGKLTVLRQGDTPVEVPAGGRGIDQDGNGVIDSTEGVNATAPRTVLGSRDGLRQTVVDLMQLTRQIEVGVDMDGDGTADLNAQRIYYAGQSFGGIYGTIFMGVEPAIKAGVPNVPGGSITEVARLGAFRPLTGLALLFRAPSLINVADPSGIAFNENIPLRDEPVRINNVLGAMAIQQALDRFEWAQQAGNPASYAAFIRKQPLPGQAAKPVIFQFAKGDMTVPNPTTSAILRAGDLADRATYYRNDLSYAFNNAVGKNPHVFLTNIGNPAAAPWAVAAQAQIAVFFASNGALTIEPPLPNGAAAPFFEVPINLPLPETVNFIP
jgi:Bacterial Ig-like domain